jgi:hypothetical protein
MRSGCECSSLNISQPENLQVISMINGLLENAEPRWLNETIGFSTCGD